MSVNRRFFALDNENSVFAFKIDTTKVVAGATDGSQLDNQFIMPFSVATQINAILRVSDGRPDVVVTNANINSNRTLSFATPGVYDIEIIGSATNIGFNPSQDRRKFLEINKFGDRVTFYVNGFLNCTNLTIKATNQPQLIGSQSYLFQNIKEFDPSVNLTLWNFSRVTACQYIFNGVQTAMTSIPQGFIGASDLSRFYQGAPISGISKIEIISDFVENVTFMLPYGIWRGRLILKTPNLKNITSIFNGTSNPPSLGEVDIRSVTTTTNFITLVMSTANVDATLLGWQNNFDWTGVTVTATYNFRNSKYSNNPAVIAAKAFLESKGITFTNLTMA